MWGCGVWGVDVGVCGWVGVRVWGWVDARVWGWVGRVYGDFSLLYESSREPAPTGFSLFPNFCQPSQLNLM